MSELDTKALEAAVLAYDKSPALHRSEECNEVALRAAVSAYLAAIVDQKMERAVTASLETLDAVLSQAGGCGDGNCCIHRPGGQHTNGGCRCVYATRDDQAQRHKIEKVLRSYQIAVKSIKAALTAQEPRT